MASTDFFQSPEFGAFQEKIPYRGKTWSLKIHERGKGGPVVATALIIRQQTRLNKCFLWIPYGPVFPTEILPSGSAGQRSAVELTPLPDQNRDEKIVNGLEELFYELNRIAKQENAIFSRIEPPVELSHYFQHERLRKFRLKKAPKSFSQEHSLILDLSQNEAALLIGMHEKGRYNIHLAERNRVTVQRFDDLHAMGAEYASSEFYKLLEKTATGEGRPDPHERFRQHPKNYYDLLLRFFGPKKMSSLFVAQHEGKIIAGIIVIWYGDTATYYYGTLSYEYRPLMAPYLLQWEALREAKKRGYRYYDFFGIAPENEPNHSLRGVTEFKKKFGGTEVHFGKAYDLVHQPFWYWVYRMM